MKALLIAAAVIALAGCSDAYQAKAERVAAEMAAKSNAPKRISRDEFRELVEGKNWNDVIAAVGKPDATQEVGDQNLWYYEARTFDPITGKPDARVQVAIRAMTVKAVNFY